MATPVEMQVDFEKRKKAAVQELDGVLKKHSIILKARLNQDGPFIAILDNKQYEEKPRAAKKVAKAAKSGK
jgi:hypothetical protein